MLRCAININIVSHGNPMVSNANDVDVHDDVHDDVDDDVDEDVDVDDDVDAPLRFPGHSCVCQCCEPAMKMDSVGVRFYHRKSRSVFR